MSWLIPRQDLSTDQLRAVELKPTKHRLVLGSPGSGKTSVLLYRAHFLINRYEIYPKKCRLFIYTKVLSSYIRTGLQNLNLPIQSVTTFDSWCCSYYNRKINDVLPKNGKSLDYPAIRSAVWEKTRQLKTYEKPFDFVLVDEGQDLDLRDFRTIAAVAQHVTVFMDPMQKIYERDADEKGIAEMLGLRNGMLLTDTHRCTSYIVEAGASFLHTKAEQKRFKSQSSELVAEKGMLPLFYIAKDEDDEFKNLVDVIRTRDNRPERIAILFLSNKTKIKCALKLKDVGMEVEVKRSYKDSCEENDFPDIDFSTRLPKLMAIPSSKGLTFDAVLLPYFDWKYCNRNDIDLLKRWIFVGITRAINWFYVSTSDIEKTLFFEVFSELEQRELLTIEGRRFGTGVEKDDLKKYDFESEDTGSDQDTNLADMF